MHRFVNGCVDSNKSHGIFDWAGNFATPKCLFYPVFLSLSPSLFCYPFASFGVSVIYGSVVGVCRFQSIWIWKLPLKSIERSRNFESITSQNAVWNAYTRTQAQIHIQNCISAFAVCIRFASAAAIAATAATSNDRRNCWRNVEPYRRLWMHVWINVATAI